MVDMSRVNRIWNHPLYQTHLHQLLEAEEEREFCRHTVEHFLDVARLTYIFVLEAGLSISREVIYAAALLHDIGRRMQYDQGIPHEKASAGIAKEILPECGFSGEETGMRCFGLRHAWKNIFLIPWRQLWSERRRRRGWSTMRCTRRWSISWHMELPAGSERNG